MARVVIQELELRGTVVTLDARHTQRETAQLLDRGADYVLTVKGNQPGPQAALQLIPDASFSPPLVTTEKGHGRIDVRRYRSTEVAATYWREELGLPGAQQVVRVERERTVLRTGTHSQERVHAISSREPARASLAQLAGHIRKHWGVENKLPYVRDVRDTFDEDYPQVRGTAAQGMAILRNLAISCLRLAGCQSTATGLRWVARDPLRAAALIGA